MDLISALQGIATVEGANTGVNIVSLFLLRKAIIALKDIATINQGIGGEAKRAADLVEGRANGH